MQQVGTETSRKADGVAASGRMSENRGSRRRVDGVGDRVTSQKRVAVRSRTSCTGEDAAEVMPASARSLTLGLLGLASEPQKAQVQQDG